MHLLCKNTLKYRLPEILNKKILNKIPHNKNDKFLTIYMRSRAAHQNKFHKDHFFNYAKNCNPKNYIDAINYYLERNWKVILIGDEYLTIAPKLNNSNNLIYAEKLSLNKKLLEIFSMINSQLVINSFGGAAFLSFYTHSIYTNIFPVGFMPAHKNMDKIIANRKDFVLHKNIYFKGKKASEKKLKVLSFKDSKLPKNYSIKDNSKKQILNFCAKHHKKYLNV